MSNLVQELNSLDFKNYIGGPMQAAIEAQSAAAMSTVDFIQSVGFNDAGDDVRYVDFKIKKNVPAVDANGAPILDTDGNPTTVKQDVTIKVPFLTMLTIPALRIDNMTIDFNAKLTSTETRKTESSFSASAQFGLNYKVVKFKASASYKRKSSHGLAVEKTYNLGVKVTAVNDELPEGLDRILTMLEENIASE